MLQRCLGMSAIAGWNYFWKTVYRTLHRTLDGGATVVTPCRRAHSFHRLRLPVTWYFWYCKHGKLSRIPGSCGTFRPALIRSCWYFMVRCPKIINVYSCSVSFDSRLTCSQEYATCLLALPWFGSFPIVCLKIRQIITRVCTFRGFNPLKGY